MGEAKTDVCLRASVTVQTPAAVAFRVFTEGIQQWWVPEFTWSGPDCLDTIGIEGWVGGKAYEIGPHGFRLDWGRLLVWEPPQRLVLCWQIAPDRVPQPDPTKASEVEVHFHDHRESTVVDLEHRYFDRHGPDGAGYRQAMAVGWRELLDRYAARCPAEPKATNGGVGPR
jgi:uncharacterized protein YndB with AHSA1/START domain